MNDVLFDNLEIRRFRTFEYLKIEPLGNLNLFIGKNNVGKSTLLEALWLFANIGSPEVIHAILKERDEPKELHRGRASEPAPWRLFHGHPALERISSSIQIGRIGAPDSALVLSITWLSDSGGQEEGKEFDSPEDADGKILTPALVVKYGAMRRVLRLDSAFSDLRRRWSLQERSNQELAIPCIFIGPFGLDDAVLQSLWEKVALSDAKNDVIEAMRIIAPETDDFALLPSDIVSPSVRSSAQCLQQCAIMSWTLVALMYRAGFSSLSNAAKCLAPHLILAPSLWRRSSHQLLPFVSTTK